jgi:4-amino-4-deoxy-L-arabinose transferase-like glycosyltransferase
MMLPLVASAWVRDLWAPDEPRYAQVAREVYEGGDLLVMHLCGRVYPDKPPLLFWMSGALGWLSDWSEFWMRLPSITASLGTAVLVSLLARRWWGDRAAALAPALFLGTALVTEIGGRLQIDPLLTFLCTLALYLIDEGGNGTISPRARVLIAGLCVGAGGLAKGPVALVNVGLVVAAWAWLAPRGCLPRVRAPIWITSLVLALAPSLIWATAVSLAEPQIARELFFGQHAGRVSQADRHPGPIWKHFYRMSLLLLPWTFAVIGGIGEAWRGWRLRQRGEMPDAGLVKAAAWLLVLLLFFSIIPPKRDLYLLPAYPAAALLAARVVTNAIKQRRVARWIGLAGPTALLLACASITLGWLFYDQVEGLVWRGAVIATPLVIGSILALMFLRKGMIEEWTVAILVGWCVFGVLAAALLMRPVNSLKSARQVAQYLAARPEHPSQLPCRDIRPEAYRFYGDGRVPAVEDDDLEAALRREGRDFLALVSPTVWDTLDPYLKRKLRVLKESKVGGKEVLVLGAGGS